MTATQVGTYTWLATYTGDGLNNGAIDNGANESLTTVKASPTIATVATASPSLVVGTASLSDAATISGGYNVSGGSITFTLTEPDGTVITEGPVAVSGDGTYNAPTPVTATQVGTYTWLATYTGDGLNNGAIDNGTNETLGIVAATPPVLTITKVADQGTVTAGSQIGYTVTITNTGGSAATGLALSDPLPPGGNEFFKWTIDTTTGTPSDFAINGSPGSESLALSTSFLASPDSLAPGHSISVHITTPTTVGDVSGAPSACKAASAAAPTWTPRATTASCTW